MWGGWRQRSGRKQKELSSSHWFIFQISAIAGAGAQKPGTQALLPGPALAGAGQKEREPVIHITDRWRQTPTPVFLEAAFIFRIGMRTKLLLSKFFQNSYVYNRPYNCFLLTESNNCDEIITKLCSPLFSVTGRNAQMGSVRPSLCDTHTLQWFDIYAFQFSEYFCWDFKCSFTVEYTHF